MRAGARRADERSNVLLLFVLVLVVLVLVLVVLFLVRVLGSTAARAAPPASPRQRRGGGAQQRGVAPDAPHGGDERQRRHRASGRA